MCHQEAQCRYPGMNTSWGKPEEQIDVKTKKRMQTLLRASESLGELASMVSLVCLVPAVFWMLSEVNFLNLIFNDGTVHTCMYDGGQETVTNVN